MKPNFQNIIDGVSANLNDARETKITPEMVRVVADKVYALWLRDLQIEHERLGVHSNLAQRQRGA